MLASWRGSEQSGHWDCVSHLTIQGHGRQRGGSGDESEGTLFKHKSYREFEDPILPASKDAGMVWWGPADKTDKGMTLSSDPQFLQLCILGLGETSKCDLGNVLFSLTLDGLAASAHTP